jgi:hypothetical protein
MHMPGELLQQPGQLPERVRRGQLVEIVNDQIGPVMAPGQLRQNSPGNGRLVEFWCLRQLRGLARLAGGLPDGREDGE